ncbi:terminase small subunit [Providencia rettgeri]
MFCREYLSDLNTTQAAIHAGYSDKTANVKSSRLLINVSIQNRIKDLN